MNSIKKQKENFYNSLKNELLKSDILTLAGFEKQWNILLGKNLNLDKIEFLEAENFVICRKRILHINKLKMLKILYNALQINSNGLSRFELKQKLDLHFGVNLYKNIFEKILNMFWVDFAILGYVSNSQFFLYDKKIIEMNLRISKRTMPADEYKFLKKLVKGALKNDSARYREKRTLD